jgi:hypothetical protein
MYYANLSANGWVTREGLNYTVMESSNEGIECEHIQIPFIGFDRYDFVELPNGALTLLCHFDPAVVEGRLLLLKGDGSKKFVLVMYSIAWNEDGFLGEIEGFRAPEHAFRFKSRQSLDTDFFHEYLLVLKRDVSYEFGYCSENAGIYLRILMKCISQKDELIVKILKPGDEGFN